MKNHRLIPLFVSAALFTALGTSAVCPALAQPAPAQAGKKRKKAKAPIMAKIEAKMGKPLTPAQRKQLIALNKIRMQAVKAATENFNRSAAKVTGLTAADMATITAPKRKAPKRKAPKAAR